VFLNGYKVCGILIESPSGPAPAKDRLIVGVGINVNNSWQNAPREAAPSGTALCDVTGRQHDLPEVLLGILRMFESRLAQLASGDPQLPAAWQQLDLLAGKHVAVEASGARVEGQCAGIAEDGALLVDTPSGPERSYSGTVRTI
jgi:BirA family transcriptional regulator, biotin operon repressor / biotin---[acetyl-CoA-carboxylase] ligase